MKIFVAQIYIEAGVEYPFSTDFQKYISQELTKRIVASDAFVQKYAEDFNVIFRMSAKASIAEPEVKGPTLFRKHKNVEFTVFLPFDKHDSRGQDVYRRILRQLLDRIIDILKNHQIDVSQVSRDADEIIERIVNDPMMIVER